MLSDKQRCIKYHFLSVRYETTSDWTPVIQAIGEHSTHRQWAEPYLYKFITKIIKQYSLPKSELLKHSDPEYKHIAKENKYTDYILSKSLMINISKYGIHLVGSA